MLFSRRFFIASLLITLASASASTAIAQTLPATMPGLLPVPDAIAQDHARITIYSLFKTDFAKTAVADRQALAKRLLAEAATTKDDPTSRYVLLLESTDLAALAGDPATAFKAATDLGRLYRVDALEQKKQALFRSSFLTTTPDANEALARMSLDTAEEAALADAFDSVTQLTALADAAAGKTQKLSFVTWIHPKIVDLHSLVVDFPPVQKALATLNTDPHDRDAELLIGRFYALRKGQWSLGLPHLARGNDEPLRDLAVKEIIRPTDGLSQAVLGDAWWDYSLLLDGRMRTIVQRHACEWYRLALPNLAGLTLTRIQSRMNATPVTQTASGATSAPTDLSSTPGGVALLPLLDLAKDVGGGKWSLTSGALECTAPTKYACVQLPYSVPEEYDLRATFTRLDGEAPITLLLTTHNKSFGFALDVKGEARFERVDGKIAKDNPTAAPVVINNHRKYTVTVEVRNDGLRALLDDKLVTQWKTDYKDMSRYVLWKLPSEKLCGLGVNNARVVFDSVELVEVNGKGRPLR